MRVLLSSTVAAGLLVAACSLERSGTPAPSETVGTELEGVVAHEAIFAAG